MNERIRYACSNCDREYCKLWRLPHVPLSNQILRCHICIPNYRIRTLDRDGTFLGDHGSRSNQINNLIPAVPTADMTSFWTYTTIPPDGIKWWQSLRS